MEKMIPAVRSSAPLPPRDSSDKKQKESRVSACGSADAVSASKVISSVTTPSESSFSDREVHVEPVTTPQDIPATELEEEITTLEYLRSAIAGLAAWAGSETGADVTKILAKLPKIVPDDWMGLPIEELDRLGVGNFLRLLTYSTKVPEKAAKVIPAMQEAIQILGQMEGYERKDEVLGRLFNNLFGRNLILTTASALVCGLKTGKHSLALITKLGSLTGLLPHSALNYLNSTKANLSASASRIVGPLLLYSMYGDLTNIYTGYIRGQALQELGRPLTDIHEDGSVHVSEDVTMVRYLKEYNPEFYRLLKNVARHRSGATLLTDLGLDMVKITAYVTGIFFAGKKINDLSLGVLANGLMVLTASFSLLRYTYNQKSLQAQRDTLKRWSALAPELENPSIDKKSAESLRARERRQFIATGLIGLEQFKQQGIAIDSFLIPEVEYYLEQSTKDKISDVVRIHEVTRILKENLNIAGQFSLQQIRMAAQCLVVEAQRYRTKKIMRCITMLQNGSLSFYGTRKEIDALLQKKAEAIQIQLNSRYSVLRLYKMLSRVDLVQYPPEHPIRRILNLDSSLLDAIRGGNIDEKTARQALHAALGL